MTNHEHEEALRYDERDVAYLQATLGMDPNFLETLDMANPSEYTLLAQDSLALRDQALQNRISAAENQGITVTQEAIDAWQPDEQTLDYLVEQSAHIRKRARMVSGMASFVADSVELAESMGVPLRPHQKRAVQSAADFMMYARRNASGRGKSGAIVMPTGDGKTATFAKITSQLKHEEDPKDPIRVLIITPTQTILEQTEGQGGMRGLQKFAPHLNVGKYYQFEKELDKDVCVMTMASFNALMAKDQMPHFDAVIIDELHTAIGPKIASNVQEYCDDKVLIGVTATDKYDDERTIFSVVDHMIHEVPFREAVEAGRLAPVRGHLIDVNPIVNRFELSTDENQMRKQLRAAHLLARIEHSKPIIKDAIEAGHGVLVRCPAGNDIDIAVAYSELFKEVMVADGEHGFRWINSDYVGGSSKRQTMEDRRVIFEEFDRGDVDVLFYVKGIGMGWDSPHAKVFINWAASTSSVEIRQGIGRVMRLTSAANEAGELEPVVADVYDFRDPKVSHQYTVLDALESKDNELIEHKEGISEPPIPGPRYTSIASPEILDIDSQEVGSLVLAHSEGVVMPDSVEVNKSVDMLRRSTVEIGEASRILGVDMATMRKMLLSVGSNPAAPIPKSEVVAMLELLPTLEEGTLPPMDVSEMVSLSDLQGSFTKHVRLYSLLPFARRQGFTPYRIKGSDNLFRYYFTPDEAARITEMVNSELYRFTYYKNND